MAFFASGFLTASTTIASQRVLVLDFGSAFAKPSKHDHVSINIRIGSSIASLTRFKNEAASLPSRRRWS